MVKKFEFGKNLLELDIAGETFQLDVADVKTIEKIEKFGKESLEKVKEAEKLSDEQGYSQVWDELIQFLVGYIDSMLGEGSVKRIFKERKINFFDCLDVAEFINTEASKHRSSKLQKLQQYSPSRAERRAKK